MQLISRSLVRAALAGAGAVLALALPARARAQSDALSLTEVLDLRRRGVSNKQILRAANEYCISFTMSDSVERTLGAAGADSALVSGLRGACGAPMSGRLTPGVLVDDDIAAGSGLGAFVSSDQLCTARLEPTGVRIENRRRRGGCVIAYPSDPITGDVRITLVVGALLPGRDAQVMLGFGRGESWDQYQLAVSASGRVELCRSEREGCRTLFTRVEGTTVRPGFGASNELEVLIRGRTITASVNGGRIGEYQAAEAPAGGLVLGVGATTSAIFRHLTVRQPDRTAASR